MPRILKLTPYCFPEEVSNSHMTRDLKERLYQNGFTIEQYVPTPCRGLKKEDRKKYKRIKYEELDGEKTIVHRFSMFREGKNPVLRAIRYSLINIIQYYKGSHAKDIDVLFTGSTPPTQGILYGKLKKKLSKRYGYKVPFVYNLQDVFPDSLVNAKMTKKGSFIWKVGRKIEDYTYKSADVIITISEDFKGNIMAKGVAEEKIVVVSAYCLFDIIERLSL